MTTFKALAIGDRFHFVSEQEDPGAVGPWRKVGPRNYVHISRPELTCRIGGWHTSVIRVPDQRTVVEST